MAVSNQNKMFLEKDLWLISIALGKGNSEEKATELFELYDFELTGYLDRDETKKLFQEFTAMVAVCMPYLGIGRQDSNEFLDAETIHWY